MSPRTRRSRGSALPTSASPTPHQHHNRTSRRSTANQHSSSPEQRPRVAAPSKTPRNGVAARVKRHTRSSSNQQNSSNADNSSAGDEAASGKNEGDDSSDDVGEPEAKAPSGPITRRRGHQTGLSVTLSKTNLGNVQAGTKRELSVSTVDSETRNRPRKMSKLGARPEINQANEPEDDAAMWDSDYGAVDDISDTDHGLEDSDIERNEEQQIIESIEHDIKSREKRGHSVDSWADFRFDTPPANDESQFFTEHFALTEPNTGHEFGSPAFGRHRPTPTSDPAPVRRVRFADVISTTASSTNSSTSQNSENGDFTFPDLLLEQEQAQRMPAKITTILNITDNDEEQYSDGSYWELDRSEPSAHPRAKTPRPEPQPLRQRSSSGSSGYETDTSEGETTDEDPIPPQTVNKPETNLFLVTKSTTAGRKIFRRTAIANTRSDARNSKGPCLGTWIADPDKPIGVVDHRTKKMVYVRPRSAHGASTGSIVDYVSASEHGNENITLPSNLRLQADDDSSDGSGANQESATHSHVSGVMAGLDANIAADIAATSGLTDPSQAFLFGLDVETQDEDDPEYQLDITDFIDFGDDSTDSNGDDENFMESEELVSPVTPLSSQKLPTIRPKQHKDRTSSQSLLSHFDKGIVSAFRRNQHRHQSATRRPATGSRALAIKGGRQLAASSPISPLRKRRADSGTALSMAPFTGLNGTRMRTGTL